MKKTHKLRSLSRIAVRAAIKRTDSVSEAARELGVNRSSVHRWIKAGVNDEPVDPDEQARIEAWHRRRRVIRARWRNEVGGPKDPRWLLQPDVTGR